MNKDKTKYTIKVDYYHHEDRTKLLKSLIVEAYCVGGDFGIMAFYQNPHPECQGFICEAHGDDGFWWYVGQFHSSWASEIIEKLENCADENCADENCADENCAYKKAQRQKSR